MTRLVLGVVSWTIMAGGLLVAVVWTLMVATRVGGSFRGAVMELLPGVVVALFSLAGGGVLQMLVSIDARLEVLNGRR